MKCVVIIASGLLLTGCFQTYGITCPQLAAYSPEFQKQVAEELTKHDIPNTAQMIQDYGKTRDAVRVCQKYQAKEPR